MIRKLLEFIKPILVIGSVFLLLQATGLWGDATYLAQSAVLKTGMLDAADVSDPKDQMDFDYNFTIKDLNGNKTTVDKLKGKVIFLNMWATWCGPCRAEMPTIEKLYQSLSAADKEKIAFVILSIDNDSDHDKIVKYIAKNEYTFPVFQPSGTLTEQLNVPSIPTTLVVSKAGKIEMVEMGTTNFNTTKFKNFLNALIAK